MSWDFYFKSSFLQNGLKITLEIVLTTTNRQRKDTSLLMSRQIICHHLSIVKYHEVFENYFLITIIIYHCDCIDMFCHIFLVLWTTYLWNEGGDNNTPQKGKKESVGKTFRSDTHNRRERGESPLGITGRWFSGSHVDGRH